MRHATPPRDPSATSGSAARSLALGLALVLAIGGGIFALWRWLAPPSSAAVIPTPVAPEEFAPAVHRERSPVRFTDITEEAGIRFRHFNGARGKKLLPETMGSGCAFLDHDLDGDADLVLVNSAPWPGDELEEGRPAPTPALYENDGTGRFTDVTAERGLAVTFYGMGVAVGDIDRDGRDDLFFTAVGGDHLFRNAGDRFVEVTEEVGVPAAGLNTWSTSAAFLDVDLDGWLDLFVCRYITWSPQIDLAQDFQITGIGRAYGPPQNFAGAFCRLLHNEKGHFVDVSRAAGIEIENPYTRKPLAKALGVSVQDLDHDGDPDLLVADDTVQNLLFRNRGDGTFEEVGLESGIAFDAAGNTRGAMGIDWAEIDPDGTQAVVIGNFSGEITALYKSLAPGELPFTDDAVAEGIGNPSRHYMKFGVFFFDFDLDGRLDILEANGHLESEIGTVQAEQTWRQPPQIFWNAGPDAPRGFEALGPAEVGPDLFHPMVGRGSAFADIDGDGDLDFALTANGGPARLIRNDGGNANGWVRFLLEGTRGNTDAYGARVEIEAGGRVQRASVTSARGYLSQSERVLTFGLGSSERVDRVRIWWPGTTKPQELGSLPARALHRLRQP